MKHIPLKQYVDSKRQLLAAADTSVPTTIMEYDVRKYCTLPVGDEEDPIILALKPRHMLAVEWVYEDQASPTPTKVEVFDRDTMDLIETEDVFWSGDKLNKWLMRHAKDGVSRGHKPTRKV